MREKEHEDAIAQNSQRLIHPQPAIQCASASHQHSLATQTGCSMLHLHTVNGCKSKPKRSLPRPAIFCQFLFLTVCFESGLNGWTMSEFYLIILELSSPESSQNWAKRKSARPPPDLLGKPMVCSERSPEPIQGRCDGDHWGTLRSSAHPLRRSGDRT